jgi:predicted dehydrogenase
MKKALLLSFIPVFSSVVMAQENSVRLMTLDPGHFHAGLVQKFMFSQVSPVVHVYSPGGPELQDHLNRIGGFNTRAEDPTRWQEKVYQGPDFLDRMIKDKPGNVVVISGNNQRKTEYINRSVTAKLNVLADKPMAINGKDFKLLRKSFDTAKKQKVLLYDIMTERYEITSMLQRDLAMERDLFGSLEKGTPQDPSVIKESVHHYSKTVAGKPLVRPPWFFDVEQQGEAVPDVGTHLVDLVQWGCFPGQVIDWKKEIKVLQAGRWPTSLSREQFKKATGLDEWPDYLKKYADQAGALQVYQNGDVVYSIRGVHAKVAVMWRFEAPPGTGDTHFSKMRGSQATIFIRQGAEQGYKPKLYVESSKGDAKGLETRLRKAINKLTQKYPGLDLKAAAKGFEIVIPEKYSTGHEAHFTEVTSKYLEFMKAGDLPDWEVPNMIAKYYTTTEAFKLAHKR